MTARPSDGGRVTARLRELAIGVAGDVLDIPDPRWAAWLAGASGVFLVLVLVWIALLAANPPEGSAASRWSFVSASLIAPALLTVLGLTRGLPGGGRDRVAGVIGMAGAAVYAALVTVAYTSQYALLPRLDAAGAVASAGWHFADHASIPYFLALLGYAAFGLAAAPLSLRLLGAGGLWPWAGGVLLASGAASVAGFAGYAAGVAGLEALTVVGGVLTVPFAVVLGIAALRVAAARGGYAGP